MPHRLTPTSVPRIFFLIRIARHRHSSNTPSQGSQSYFTDATFSDLILHVTFDMPQFCNPCTESNLLAMFHICSHLVPPLFEYNGSIFGYERGVSSTTKIFSLSSPQWNTFVNSINIDFQSISTGNQ